MRKLGIAALVAAGIVGASAQSAWAGGPEAPVAVCGSVSELFETANVQMDPLPEPLGTVAGTAYRTVCKVTG